MMSTNCPPFCEALSLTRLANRLSGSGAVATTVTTPQTGPTTGSRSGDSKKRARRGNTEHDTVILTNDAVVNNDGKAESAEETLAAVGVAEIDDKLIDNQAVADVKFGGETGAIENQISMRAAENTPHPSSASTPETETHTAQNTIIGDGAIFPLDETDRDKTNPYGQDPGLTFEHANALQDGLDVQEFSERNRINANVADTALRTKVAPRKSSVMLEAGTSCWSEARRRFLLEDNDLWRRFEGILTETSTIDISKDLETRSLVEVMRDVVELQIQKIHSHAWTMRIPFRSKTVEVRRVIQRLADLAQITKPAWSALSGMDPLLAGLPLGGLGVLVELIGNDKVEHDALLRGVDDVTDFVYIYWEVERRVAISRLTSLLKRFREILTELYLSILRFLAKASTALHRNTTIRTASNAFKRYDWASEVDDIKKLHQRCRYFALLSISKADDEKLRRLIIEALDQGFEDSKRAIEELKRGLSIEHEKTLKVVNWVSTVNVQFEHQAVRDNLGDHYADRSGTWLREFVDEWMRSEQPVFLLTGSGENSIYFHRPLLANFAHIY
ncbi:hypothetical protein VTI28DRAFT_6589 [Corynascus sepedonium]